MKANSTVLWGLFLVAAGLAGCDASRTVSLSGEVTYAGYTDGVIVIQICESESSTHDGPGMSAQTPGACVEEVVLEAPGAFAAKATISWADTEPDVQLLAYLVPNAESSLWSECEAGAFVTVSVGDHDDIELALIEGDCPTRQ